MSIPEGTTTILERTYTDYQLRPQFRLPNCVEPAPECTLEITGSTVTNVTVRGDSDGVINIVWTGSTGTTSCYINGVLDGTSTSNDYDFTGLTSGIYNLKIIEGECFDELRSIQVLDGEFRTENFTVIEPATLAASENPIIFNVATARNNGTPLPSIGTITVSTGTVADGQELNFSFTYPFAYQAKFYAKSFPNRDNYFLASTLKNAQGIAVGSNTTNEIATSISEALYNDSVIARLYDIRVDSNVITLTAKENNHLLNITTVLEGDTALSVADTQFGNAAFDGQITQDYSIYTNILVNTNIQYGETPVDNTFKRVAQLELPFNERTNSHSFDLSDVLKNFVSTPKIDFTLTGYTTIASMLCGYRVEYGEKYPLIPNSTTKKSRSKGSIDTHYVLNSALTWESDNNLSIYLGDITSGGTISNVEWLTNSPNPKFVQRNSSEFLYFLLPKDYGATLSIRGDLYFYDGTSITGETLYTVSTGSTNYGGVFMFAAGYNELGLEDYETYSGGTRKIRRVDFALYQGDDLLSVQKSYRYEIDEQARRYGVAFLNKLGTYDIFDFSGEIIDSVTHTNETYEVPRPINLKGGSPFGFQANTVYNTKVTKTIAANTGWIDLEHFIWLSELLESNRCYNYTETDQSFLVVTSVNYEKSSNDDLYNIDVTFTETLYQNSISV